MSIKPFIIKSNVGVGTSTVSAGSGLIVATGNVGIGTATPSQKLHVQGNAVVKGYSGFGSNAQIMQGSTVTVAQDLSGNLTISATSSTGDIVGLSTYNTYRHTGASLSQWISDVEVNPAILSTSTGPFDSFQALSAYPINYGSGNIAGFAGMESTPQHKGSGTVSSLFGYTTYPIIQGTGNVGTVTGIDVRTLLYSTGNVTTNYGVNVTSPLYGNGGFITGNSYGVYIGDHNTGATKGTGYNFYSAGATSKNIFEGLVGIGTTTMTSKLEVWGGNTRVASTGYGLVFPDGTFQTTAYTATASGVTSFSAGTTGLQPNMATTGAVTLSGTLIAGNGGTGQSSYTTGDILYASNGSTLSKLAAVATGNVLISNGVGVAPSWSKVDLTTATTGTLPIANGGTNSTTVPTLGAVAYGTGLSYGFTSASSTVGNILVSGGAAVPTWGPGYSTTAGAGNIVVRDSTGAINITGATVSGQMNVAVTTASTSTTTGAIITAGGIGVAGNINVGGVTNSFTGNVGIGTTTPGYRLEVSGSFAATTKSFVINHPTKPGMKLQYGSLESPYHGVRLTGEAQLVNGKCTVKLPDYITGLCLQKGSQVQITNIKHAKVIWVEDIDVDACTFTVAAKIAKTDTKKYKFYWSFTAIRKDIEILEVEV